MSIFAFPRTIDVWNDSAKYRDTILFSRVALRRNISDFPFKDHLTSPQRIEISDAVSSAYSVKKGARYYRSGDFERNDLLLLEEEEYIFPGENPDSLALYEDGLVSYANGNSHISFVSVSGGNIPEQLALCHKADEEINTTVPYAFSEKYGYLFSNPVSCGSGLEISAVLHIPSISTLKCFPEIPKICDAMNLSLSVYPEEFEHDLPHFCRVAIKNFRNVSEEENVENMVTAVSKIADLERDARDEYYYQLKPHLEDAVWRSFGILSNSRMIGYREAFDYLSHIRLGVILSILGGYRFSDINSLFFQIRRSHLQLKKDASVTQLDVDQARADLLRNFFTGGALHV